MRTRPGLIRRMYLADTPDSAAAIAKLIARWGLTHTCIEAGSRLPSRTDSERVRVCLPPAIYKTLQLPAGCHLLRPARHAFSDRIEVGDVACDVGADDGIPDDVPLRVLACKRRLM